MSQILIIAFGLSLISCAHIKPTNPAHPEAEKDLLAQAIEFEATSPKTSVHSSADIPVTKLTQSKHFLKPVQNAKVDFWVSYFSKKRKALLERYVVNGEKYRKIIEETFVKYGLPAELYYVGLIESGYYNHAKSHAGAVGPWQFMPATARRYGLKVSSQIDERQSIFKSTEAAALYFQDLYNIFGSWELALAAYNKGENGMIRRIRGANTRDYYELSAKKVLPKETRHYVPKVLAVMHVLKNAKQYQVAIKKYQDNPFEDVVVMNLKKSVRISTMAAKLKVSTHLLKQLNQDLKGHYIPYPGRKGIDLYLPRNANAAMASFNSYLKQLPTKPKAKVSATNVNYHKVRKNESLYSLAKRYGLSIKELKRLNNLKRNTIFVGQKIKIKSQTNSRVDYSYTVKRGDNLFEIARIFNLNVGQLKKMNRLKRSTITIGQRLKVPAHKMVHYKVRAGDFLGKIAKRHGTSIKKIKSLNNLSRKIYPGQKIIVKVDLI